MPFVQFPLTTKDRTECLANGEFPNDTRIITTNRIPVSICRIAFVFISGSILLQLTARGLMEGAL